MNDKIKVLNVYNGFYRGGTEKYIRMLLEGVDPERYEHSVCCLIERGTHADWVEEGGYPTHVLAATNDQSPRHWLRNLRQIWKLSRILKRERIDVVHSHDFFPALMTRLAAIIARTPVVFITHHNLFEWLKPIHHRINRFLAKRTTRIVAVSKSVMRRSAETDRVDPEKYVVIYNGLDFTNLAPDAAKRERARRELGAEGKRVIGTIGGLTFRKGQRFLIEAFGDLAKEADDLALVVVGGAVQNEPTMLRDLEAEAERLGVRDRVTFMGARTDATDLLNAFDVFALPSVAEGFGYVLVEAMATEVPVVCSDISTFREITREGEFGDMFENRNSEDLADKLRDTLGRIDELRARSKRARSYALKTFGIETTLARYNDLYDRHAPRR
jgi:glycosyltransferase involved in cell wall biosynthesis